VDYTKEPAPLVEDLDEPLMPISDRIVLVYGALMLTWKSLLRSESDAATSSALYARKLALMQGKLNDSTDFPMLVPSKSYLARKRSGPGGGARIMSGFAATLGGSSNQPDVIRGTANSVAIYDAQGELKPVTNRINSGINSIRWNLSSAVGITDAQTLTNKSIDSNSNTITNIKNADIKTGAAIDRGKLATGTADQVIINDGFGILSSEAQLAVSRGGTGAATLTGYVKGSGTSALTAASTIPRADIATGTIDHVLINSGSGAVSSEAQLAVSRGGTGAATLTGYVKGTGTSALTASATLPRADVATGTANHVLINSAGGALSSEASLAVTRGGTGLSAVATGDILYGSATNTVSRLAVGTNGNVLTLASGIPSWGSAALAASVVTKTSAYTATVNDDVILCSASGGAFTITLPAAATRTGKFLWIKKTDSTFSAVTVDGNGSETINGALTTTLNTQYEGIQIVSDGSNWTIIDRLIPSEATLSAFTITAFGTVSSQETYYKRNGDSLRMFGDFQGSGSTAVTATVALPSGLTIAGSTRFPTGNAVIVGRWYVGIAVANSVKTGTMVGVTGGSTIGFGIDAYTSSTNPFSLQQGGAFGGSGVVYGFDVTIPIAGWNG
jgi:hypothetical protein